MIDLCGITALLVAAMFTLMLVSLEHLRSEETLSHRSSDLLTQTAQVAGSVLDMETELRGFLLSDNRSFLAPYDQAERRLKPELGQLESLADGRQETDQVARIRNSTDAYLTSYGQPLIANGSHLGVAKQIRTALDGNTRVDRIRAQLTRLEDIDRARRAPERSSANSESNLAVLFGAVGLGMSVLLLIALAVYLVKRFLEPMRTVAVAAREVAAGRLAARVPEVGMGEAVELGRSFNAMAATLESRNAELSKAHKRLERAAEEAHSASQLKSNFLANMSHEIRTPLNGLVGSMELLSETPLSREQTEFVELARSSGAALLTVVNDVLDIAKIEAGRVEIEQRDFDVYELAEGACDVVAAAASNKGLELQSLIRPDVPPLVRGDRVRVSQILTNLLSNAVKFTSRGEVTLEVGVVARAGSQVKLRFEVRDTGIGIEKTNLGRLFEPFTQADAGTTRTYGGTGLGLTIAHELTTMMHGSLSVDSELGSGSHFRIQLPFTVSDVPREPLSLPEELNDLHVLIVDGNATNRRIFAGYSASWGMRPELADAAAAALASLEFAAGNGDPYDLVLAEAQLGDRSGLELAEQLAADPNLKHIPVILLSHSRRGVVEAPSQAIAAMVPKPVRQSKLLDAITGVVRDVGEIGEPAPVELSHIDAQGRRILVAEDHTVNWMLVKRLLGKRGHLAVNATNGQQALEKLQEEDFDLVLMDCQMPVLDGYQTTCRLREREAGGRRRVPVVAMTAHAMHGDRERCLAAGMDDYLSKPITSASIDAMLARWLPSAPMPADPLDRARMRELRSLFPGAETAETIAQLQADVDAQLERLASALHDADGAEAAQAAHRIKGSAHMVGARMMAEAAGQLQAAAEQDPRQAAHVADRLREQWRVVNQALELERAERVRPARKTSAA